MSASSDHEESASAASQTVDQPIEKPSKSYTRPGILGRLYLVAAFLTLLTIVFWHSEEFQVFGSRFMLGWDNPNYVRLANELTGSPGPLQTLAAWSYPQLYVQLLAAVGYIAGNVTLVNRVLPLAFGLLSIGAVFLVVRDISSNIHIAGLSAILQATSISFLKLVSGNNRNLMAFSLVFVAMLLVQRLWTRKTVPKDYLYMTTLSGIIAGTSFETFLIFSLTLIISGLLTRKRRNIIMSILVSIVPVILLFAAFPSYLLTYAETVQAPIQTPKQVLGQAELYYWMGGSLVMVLISLVGIAYALTRWRKKNDPLSLLIFVWSGLLLSIFVAAYVGIEGLQAEFGVRALLLVPVYVLAPLGVFVLCTWISRILRQRRLQVGEIGSGSIANTLAIVLVIGIILTSSGFGVSESGTYFNPYISATTYNKMVLTANYVGQRTQVVPVVVFDGSAGYDSLFRGYIGALMGEHFAYYGDVNNLLQLKPTPPNSSDAYTASLEALLSKLYLDELGGNATGPTEFGHQSYITSPNMLMLHTIILITPDLYDGPLPGFLAPFLIGNGIFVVPPGGLSAPQQQSISPSLTISRDGNVAQISGVYTSLNTADPSDRYLTVNASSGFQTYNITSYPSDWTFLGIRQGGNPSSLDFQPMRPNGNAAMVGNDYADSLVRWTPIPGNATIQTDTVSKMEGRASVSVYGTGDLFGNTGLTLSTPDADISAYNSISFWARCLFCSSIALGLEDSAGGFRLLYPPTDLGPPGLQFKRFTFNIGTSSGGGGGLNLRSILSISFLALSEHRTPTTLWIDDVVVQNEGSNSPSLYKGRVLPRDAVEFLFEERIPRSASVPSVLPFLSYSPVLDELSLIATTAIFVLITILSYVWPRVCARKTTRVR
jgi:hypothetical protein